jgi:hypothetical protein
MLWKPTFRGEISIYRAQITFNGSESLWGTIRSHYEGLHRLDLAIFFVYNARTFLETLWSVTASLAPTIRVLNQMSY